MNNLPKDQSPISGKELVQRPWYRFFTDVDSYMKESAKSFTSVNTRITTTEENIAKLNAIGPTSSRPANVRQGFQYYDTDLAIPIWWSNIVWRDAAGNPV